MRQIAWLVVGALACTARNPAYRPPGVEIDAQPAPVADGPSAPPQVDAAPLAIDSLAMPDAPGGGLTGSYYDGNNFNTLKFMRVDRIIDFPWANDPPDPRLTFSGFTVRWTGSIRPLYSETYTFTVYAGDGCRLRIDGKPIIDAWKLGAPADYVGTIDLAGNRTHDIVLEYLHETGWSVVRLIWESPSQKAGVVRENDLLPQ